MLPVQYLLIFFFAVSCFFVLKPLPTETANRRIFKILSVLIMLMVAFRPSQMVDYEVYQMAFDGLEGFRFEPGFHLIRWISLLLGNVYFWGFFIYALLCVSLKLTFIRNYPSIQWMALLVYLSGVVVTQDMIAIRAGVACSLFLFAIDYKLRNEKKKMYVALVTAVLFHYSALACFILPFISVKRLYRKPYLLALLISHLMAIMGIFLNNYIGILNSISALEAVLGMHQEGDEPMNFLNLLQLGHVLICVAIWMNAQKLEAAHREVVIYLKLYTIGLCVMPLLALMMAMAIRLQQLFLVTEIILIPIGFSVLFKKKIYGRLLVILYSGIMVYFLISDKVYWGLA